MNIVLGASGQVGSAIVDHLLQARQPVKGIVRDSEKAETLKSKGAQAAIADAFDLPALQAALQGGKTVFLLTPETGKSDDVLGDTEKLLKNYAQAIQSTSIPKIVGLSSMGAQLGHRSGNLEMSYLLEHAFTGLNVQQIFVRPAYFYSNWSVYIPTAKEQGLLPTFYPLDLKMPMIAPSDVAEFVAGVMQKDIEGAPIYEVEGPQWYSSRDVAKTLGEVLGRPVEAHQTPRAQWPDALRQMGFTPDAVENFIEMTEIVNAGHVQPEGKSNIAIKTETTLKTYFASQLE